jgi:hypothetical protein
MQSVCPALSGQGTRKHCAYLLLNEIGIRVVAASKAFRMEYTNVSTISITCNSRLNLGNSATQIMYLFIHRLLVIGVPALSCRTALFVERRLQHSHFSYALSGKKNGSVVGAKSTENTE